MSKKAKEFLAERGIANNEMIEGAYGLAYYLSGMLETFAYQETKAKDNEIERLNEMIENRSKFINELRESTNQRIKELEEGLRTLYDDSDYPYSEEIEQLLNQNSYRDLIRDAMMFAIKDITGRVLREAAVQSMIDDFLRILNQNKDE